LKHFPHNLNKTQGVLLVEDDEQDAAVDGLPAN